MAFELLGFVAGEVCTLLYLSATMSSTYAVFLQSCCCTLKYHTEANFFNSDRER